MTKFDDNTPMPWGVHKDTKMGDVPDNYLLWLWTDKQSFKPNNRALFAYIETNLDAIQANIDRAKK